ncbi:MAG TPA: HipA domain-containing protein [Bacteroidales bacterium]|nr:HipA domain-containing protein [Bacteroidales bacterium]
MSNDNKILVYADWDWLPQTYKIGDLYSSMLRGKEVFSFEYDKNWLKSGFATNIDPDLSMYSGRQFLNDTKPNFGVFSDSSPDRWGRILMKRRESIIARKQNRAIRNLYESDYLLGVYDEYRLGGIRFKTDGNSEYLNADSELAIPPWTYLAKLEQAVKTIEEDTIPNDDEKMKWLKMLIAPGSSIGGARPKANVKDKNNNLWIAKFPSKEDDSDIGAWEIVAAEIAKKAGVNMCNFSHGQFNSNKTTFLAKRFDRNETGKRIHFASTLTLLGYNDGTHAADGAGYPEIAEFIMRFGCDVQNDLEELYRRICLSVVISNTDDHLRNHGFILKPEGWKLSPAYDINPNPSGSGLSLNISETDNSLDLELLRSVNKSYRLSLKRANEIIDSVVDAASHWRKIAFKMKINSLSIDHYQNAFRLTEK